jgi:WD40 repeat protein
VNGKICISPDSRWVLTYGEHADPHYKIAGLVINVFNLNTGELRYAPLRGQNFVFGVEVSPDGRRLATAAIDLRARLWDFERGVHLRPEGYGPLQHSDSVYAAHFSADGRRLLTACRDGMARVWDWRAGELVLPPLVHDDEVFEARFTLDGRWIITASGDGSVCVWDINDGRLITPPLRYEEVAWSLAVTPDSKHLLFSGNAAIVHRVSLERLTKASDLPLDAMCEWDELLACQRVYGGQGLVSLSPDEWLTRWRDFRSRYPDIFMSKSVVPPTAK